MNDIRPYRAIPIDSKDFVFGWYVKTDEGSWIIELDLTNEDISVGFSLEEKDPSSCGCHEVIPETVCQQLPFDAQNGDKIYEGDIAEHSCGTLYIIEQTKVGWNPFDEHCVKPHRIMRIIGTIHTTPELMEGK